MTILIARTLSNFAPAMALPPPTTPFAHYRYPISTIKPNTLNDPLPPNPPGVTDTHFETHMQTVMHSSFPPPSCRYSPPLLPESNLRHQAPSHARCWSYHDVREAYAQMPFSTTSPSSTTTALSPAPCIHPTVAMNKSNTPTRASGLFQRFQVFKDSKRGLNVFKETLKPSGQKDFQGLTLQVFRGAQGL